MHFWIDKRSPAGGFGRARVASSLAGTTNGFAYPPRRMGGKSSLIPSIHRLPQHNQHSQQHNQNSQQPSTVASVITADCHRSQQQHHPYGTNINPNNNNNFRRSNSNISYSSPGALSAQYQSQPQTSSNNNHQQYQLQTQQQLLHLQSEHSNSTSSSNSCYIGSNNPDGSNSNILPNNSSINNNSCSPYSVSPSTTTGAVLTTGQIIPVTTNAAHSSGRIYRSSLNTTNSNRSSDSSCDGNSSSHCLNHHGGRSYHHPQFGNMAIRQYQYCQPEAPTVGNVYPRQLYHNNLRSPANHHLSSSGGHTTNCQGATYSAFGHMYG